MTPRIPKPAEAGAAKAADLTAKAARDFAGESALAQSILIAPTARHAERLLDETDPQARAAVVEELAGTVLRLLRVDARRALAVAERQALAAGGEPLLVARSLLSRAHALTNLSRHAEAEAHYARAAASYRRLKEPLLAARTALGHVDALMYLGRYREAMAIGKRARGVLKRRGERRLLVGLDCNLANIDHRTDRPAAALRAYDRALAEAQNLGDASRVRAIQFNRANVLVSLGQYREAEALYRDVRAGAEAAGETAVVAWVDYSLGYLMLQRSDYGKAYAMLDDARGFFERLGDTRKLALCHLDLAEVLLEINCFERAEHHARRARVFFARLGLRYECAKAGLLLAIAAFGRSEDGNAATLLHEASADFRKEGNRVLESECEVYRAGIDRRNGRPGQAALRLARAERRFASEKLRIRQATAALRRAALAIEGRRAGLARSHLTRARRLLERLPSPWLLAQHDHLRGRLAWLAGESATSLRHLRSAVGRIESLRGRIGLDEFRLCFAADKAPIYADLVEVTLRTRKGGQAVREAFEIVERARSRALVDLLAGRLADVDSRADERTRGLCRRLEELRGEVNWLRGVGGTRAGNGQRDESRRDEARLMRSRAALRTRESEIADVMQRLARHDRRLGALTLGETITLEEAQGCLPADTALVEYYLTDERARAFVIERDGARIVELPASPRDITAELDRLRFQIEKWGYGESYVRGREEVLRAGARRHLRRLAEQVWQPLAIEDCEQLWIVPHGALHSLPFHALAVDGDRDLVDCAEIVSLPSASVLHYTPGPDGSPAENGLARSGDGSMLIVSVEDPDIPNVRAEAERLQRMFPSARILRDDEATLEALAAAASGADYLHFAAHGIFRPDDPFFSALRMADGWLSLYDIYRLKLRARLVALSACQSGRSWIGGGDEMVGLARGFLFAGASSIVVSLWPVHDSTTADLMESFYRALGAGKSAPAALRAAMIAIRATRPHPYHWAPFVVMGAAEYRLAEERGIEGQGFRG